MSDNKQYPYIIDGIPIDDSISPDVANEIFTDYLAGINRNECDVKYKIYNNGFFKWQKSTKPIYHKETIHRINSLFEEDEHIVNRKSKEEKDYYAMRRAKEHIFDLVACNDWKYFCTLTLDPKEYDSSDIDFVRVKLRSWLKNCQQRKGLEYVLVPEYHKDGEKIHAHLLINDCGLELVDSGTVAVPTYKDPIKIETADKFGIPEDQRKPVYNIPSWKYGWTTAIKTYGVNQIRTACYLMKYITKGSDKIFGKYYWSSKGIRREPQTILGMHNSLWDDVRFNRFSVRIPNTDICILYGTNINYNLGENLEDTSEYDYFSTLDDFSEELCSTQA